MKESARRYASTITITDGFCGAGGNTIGAKALGVDVRFAFNHWDKAIATYSRNNPDVQHVEQMNASLSDPRRFPSTDIGIFSAECTTHSPAGGSQRTIKYQGDMFDARPDDPSVVRSRITMYDIPRFTEIHRYRIVVCENVVEVTRWELFPDWLSMMVRLGYDFRICCFNSMFFHPTPQSRDRVYIVFWRKGNRPPQLDYMPAAPCGQCQHDVHALQSWKQKALGRAISGNPIGKYRTQYVYTCPRCRSDVRPYYFAALNVIDFTIPAERIGDRKTPLRPRTMERVRYGLDKFGSRVLVVNTRQAWRINSRVKTADASPLGTQPADESFGIAHPFTVNLFGNGTAHALDETLPTQAAECAHDALVQSPPILIDDRAASHRSGRVRSADEPLNTRTTIVDETALLQPPGFLIDIARTQQQGDRSLMLDEPMRTLETRLSSALVTPFLFNTGGRETMAPASAAAPTQETREKLAVVLPYIVDAAHDSPSPTCRVRGVGDQLSTVHAGGGNHLLVQGAAIVTLRDTERYAVAPLDEQTSGITTKMDQHMLIGPARFLTSYYGTAEKASPLDDAVPVITTLTRHALASAAPERALVAEDCFFRMLQPHEIGAAMAFPHDYVVEGTKRDRIKQYGNAVTPPVTTWIVHQCIASLAPEIGEAAQ